MNAPQLYDLVIGLDRSDQKADLCQAIGSKRAQGAGADSLPPQDQHR